jgi:hypothetical protein
MAVGAFMAVSYVGVLTDLRIKRSETTAASVAHLKQILPANETLYSIGHVDSLFTYYFETPIVPLTRENARKNNVEGVRYFCFYKVGTDRPRFPFAWDEIAAVSVDRNHQEPPDTLVVVGRRQVADRADGISQTPLVARAGSSPD